MLRYTSQGSMTQVDMIVGLQSLADGAASLSTSAESNDDSAERDLFRNFTVKVGTQGGARDASAQVSLMIVPKLGSETGNTLTGKTLIPYIATDQNGNKVTWDLDAATTATVLTWSNVMLPNSDYYIGVNNETNVAFAGTNEVWASEAYTVDNVT